MIHFVIVGILVIVSTTGVYLALTNANLVPLQASDQAIIIDNLFDIHWLIISFFLSLIVVFLLYSVIVFRRKPGEKGDGDHFEGNKRLEVVWTIAPLIIVVGMAIVGVQTLEAIEARDPDALEVNVIGKQWSWQFEYPDAGITSSILVLPVDQQVLLRLRSEDVIHSFWVPEFRVKQDALPGGEAFIRSLRINPNTLGEFKVRCAELCGLGHSTMVQDVSVRSKSDFTVWVSEQVAIQSKECDLGLLACGERWATSFGCVACHSQDGSIIVGPSWLGLFGSVVSMENDITVIADEAYIRDSILNPMANIHEGFDPVMPTDFAERLSEQQIEDLIAFIMSLTE